MCRYQVNRDISINYQMTEFMTKIEDDREGKNTQYMVILPFDYGDSSILSTDLELQVKSPAILKLCLLTKEDKTTQLALAILYISICA